MNMVGAASLPERFHLNLSGCEDECGQHCCQYVESRVNEVICKL